MIWSGRLQRSGFDSNFKPNRSYDDDDDDNDGDDDDDDNDDDDDDYTALSAGLGHMCPNPKNGLFQCF